MGWCISLIVKGLFQLVLALLRALTAVLGIPSFPEAVIEVYYDVIEYLVTGIAILANYFDVLFLFSLWGLIAIVDLAIVVYHFVMWVLKKLPLLGIK